MKLTIGTKVDITGGMNAAGIIIGAGGNAIIVSVGADRSVTLRRDRANTNSEQWRYGGLPVTVKPVIDIEGFRKRLSALMDSTDPGER